jgi:hypothetical protein
MEKETGPVYVERACPARMRVEVSQRVHRDREDEENHDAKKVEQTWEGAKNSTRQKVSYKGRCRAN